METNRPIEILLVEDNPGDIRLTKESFKEGKLSNRLSVVTDGGQALAYLRREGPFANALRPDIILLDLNLPVKNGQQVLAEIKKDERLKNIPVIVLTTSKSDEDVLKAYGLHANCFITKPVNLNEFLLVVRAIEDFWLTVVRLPVHQERAA